jgi:hypothetical protein
MEMLCFFDEKPVYGFEWDEHNERHVLYQYPNRRLTKNEVESVLFDPQLIWWWYKTDIRRGTPIYYCLGLSNQNRLIQFIFELTTLGKARIYHAVPTTKAKYKKLYSGS